MAELKLIQHTSLAIYQSSDLNSLANGSYVFGSGADLTSNVLDNTANLYVEATLLVKLGSFTSVAPAGIVFTILWSPDAGSSYSDPSSAAAPEPGYPIWTGGMSTGASAKVIVIPGIKLLPLKGKPLLGNLGGATLASSGNSAVLLPTGYTVA